MFYLTTSMADLLTLRNLCLAQICLIRSTRWRSTAPCCQSYVFIHDGPRVFITPRKKSR